MDKESQLEFRRLREEAYKKLREEPESGSYHRAFSIRRFPSFACSTRWTLYLPQPFHRERQNLVSRSVWRSDVDSDYFGRETTPLDRLRQRLQSSAPREPTMEEDSWHIAESEVEAILAKLRGVTIPILSASPKVVGCDGTSTEFDYDEIFFGASLKWWEDSPPEWRPLATAIDAVIQSLESNAPPKPKSP